MATREEWNLLKSPVPHVRPIETIWSCNKPCCEPVCTRLAFAQRHCAGFLYRPHYYNATVNSTRGYNHSSLPAPLRNSRENSSRGITHTAASRAGSFLHVGEDRGGGEIGWSVKKSETTSSSRCRKFSRCDCMQRGFEGKKKEGRVSGKIIDIVSGRSSQSYVRNVTFESLRERERERVLRWPVRKNRGRKKWNETKRVFYLDLFDFNCISPSYILSLYVLRV